ncbi:lysozyme inhibitor LprI family protein [Falsirhodobacter deserti]|uniref:lysozyme inhibitor LprI family protein n=1 Tax=Falsirhodobacter deserti TaxID=1365611 RepID=UPI000FE41ACA|nr:lysozyme inhibitor LprI family protein [Falsirhodobacter deserti]
MVIFRAILLALLPAAAVAQPCEEAATTADMRACAGKQLEQADAALNEAWAAAMERMRGIDADLPEADRGAADALRAAQRAWITLRDQGCTAEGFGFAGGTMRPLAELECRTRVTQTRTAELRDLAQGGM